MTGSLTGPPPSLPPSHPSSPRLLREQARALVAKYAPAGTKLIGKAEIDALDPPCVLVDVRTAPERAVSMIPGAISRDEFERTDGVEAALRAGRCVVPYCTVGMRSGNYALSLQKRYAKRGLRVHNGEGILLWSIDGGRLEHDGVGTSRLHTFSPEFTVVRDDVEAVQFAGAGLVGVLHVVKEGVGRVLCCWRR